MTDTASQRLADILGEIADVGEDVPCADCRDTGITAPPQHSRGRLAVSELKPKTWIRCSGFSCNHAPGTCTASPEYQAMCRQPDPAPVDAVAWMYSHAGYPVLSVLRRDMPGWTETPLYAHPDPRVAELQAEILEQARLLGMSAERELALRAKGDALGGYAAHDESCQIVTHGVWSDPIPCTCGYREALSQWKEATK